LRAVSIMIGTLAVVARRLSRRHTSIPLIPSIIQSSKITSGFTSSTRIKASSPSPVRVTS
jgi:hypothetical protein